MSERIPEAASAMPLDEALQLAAVIADAEHADCDAVLMRDGAEVCDVLRCAVLRQSDEIATLRATLALSQESLAAAVRGERVTVVDEVARLTRERDEARAAQQSAEVEREAARDELDAAHVTIHGLRERAVLTDAVRAYVEASDAHERAARGGGGIEAYVASAARIVETTEALRALVEVPRG